MKRLSAVFVIGTAVLTTSARLASRTSHVLYLSPSGAVTWTVHDRDVHSDAAERSQRASEKSVLSLISRAQRAPSVWDG